MVPFFIALNFITLIFSDTALMYRSYSTYPSFMYCYDDQRWHFLRLSSQKVNKMIQAKGNGINRFVRKGLRVYAVVF